MQKWLHEINYLRGAAAISVVIIHVASYNVTITEANTLFFSTIFINTYAHFSVPVFVMISGFLLYYKYPDHISSLGDFYLNHLLKILSPFLFFSLIYCIDHGHSFLWPNTTNTISKIALGRSSGHLWFIPMIIQLYIIYPIILFQYNRAKKHNKLIITIIILLCIQFIYSVLIIFLRYKFPDFPIKGMMIRIFISHIGYFYIGIIIQDNYKNFNIWISSIKFSKIFVISCIFNTFIPIYSYFKILQNVSIDNVMNFSYLSVIIEIPLFFCPFFNAALTYKAITLYSSKFSLVLDKFGKYSYGIYLIHVLILSNLVPMLDRIGIEPTMALFYPIIYITVITVSYFLIYLFSWIPKSQYITGSSNY